MLHTSLIAAIKPAPSNELWKKNDERQLRNKKTRKKEKNEGRSEKKRV